LLNNINGVVISHRPAGRIFPIRQQYERLAALHVAEPVGNRIIYGFIDAGSAAGPGIVNCSLQDIAVVGEVGQESYVPVKLDDHDPVLGAQLSDEGDRRLLDILQAVAYAGANIDEQGNIEWNFLVAKKSYLLSYAVLVNLEVVLGELRYEPPGPVADQQWKVHESSIQSNGFVSAAALLAALTASLLLLRLSIGLSRIGVSLIVGAPLQHWRPSPVGPATGGRWTQIGRPLQFRLFITIAWVVRL